MRLTVEGVLGSARLLRCGIGEEGEVRRAVVLWNGDSTEVLWFTLLMNYWHNINIVEKQLSTM